MKVSWFFLLISSCLCISCLSPPAPAPKSSSNDDIEAKLFNTFPASANIYIAQEGSSFQRPQPIAITLDGKALGNLPSASFFLVTVSPGSHTIRLPNGGDYAWMQIDVKGGKNYYYSVRHESGTAGKESISIVLLEEMGRLMIRQYPRCQTLQ